MDNFLKKAILALLLASGTTAALDAAYPDKGYRGFVDWDMHFGSRKELSFAGDNLAGDYWWEEKAKGYMIYGLSTSHGYQFNPHFFLGAGIILQRGAGEVEHIYFHVCDDSSMRTHFTWMPRPSLRLGIEF